MLSENSLYLSTPSADVLNFSNTKWISSMLHLNPSSQRASLNSTGDMKPLP
jgi:hypothetical protein